MERTHKFCDRRKFLVAFICQIVFMSLTSRSEGQRHEAVKKDFAFEVVSIRETQPTHAGQGITADGFSGIMTVGSLIKAGYGRGFGSANGDPMHVINLPKWADGTYYQIEARIAEEDLKAWQNQDQNKNLMRSAFRQILKERFHLVLHTVEVQRDGYQLVVGRRGIRFKPTPLHFVPPAGNKLIDGGVMAFSSDKTWKFYASSMPDLAHFLNQESDRPVYDGTNLAGRYDFTLQPQDKLPGAKWNDVLSQYDMNSLGLELKSGKGPGQDLIIDKIDKLTPN